MQKVLFFVVLAVIAFGCQTETAVDMDVTPNGNYEYIIYKSNDGAKPQVGDKVAFHYQMRAKDSIMYSTHIQGQGRPQQLPINAPIPGRRIQPIEALLPFLSVGDSATVNLRIDTLPNNPPGFEDVKYVHYDVTMMEIKTKEQLMAEQAAFQAKEKEIGDIVTARITDYNAGKLNGQIQTTESGLKYIVHEQGGGAKAQAGNRVAVSYYGSLATDGQNFDNSYKRGEPIEFILGRGSVIPGWDEGLALLNQGGKATFFIPAELGYGAQGSPPVIPANAELVFYVELEDVR